MLAVGLDNGRVQLMRGEYDENVVLLDTSLRATKIKWNTAGTVLAVAGSQVRAGAVHAPSVIPSSMGTSLP